MPAPTPTPITKVEIFRIDSSQVRLTWYTAGQWEPEGTRHFSSILEAAFWIVQQEAEIKVAFIQVTAAEDPTDES
jgi:hypothetical protein